MLWSLLKIFLFVVSVAAAAWGAGILLEADGGVQVAISDTEFTLGPLVSVIALVVLVLAVWLLLKIVGLVVAFLRFLNGDETAITRFFARNRERRGYDALAEGMMALASGEGRLALAKAAKAERFLKRPDLTTLLTAQAAEMSGDKSRAEIAYKRLLQDERTRFVGVRGIMHQKLRDGDTEIALKLAEKAFAIKPKHEDTQDALLTLQAGAGDWSGARRTLGAKLRHGSLPRDVHKRRDAVLALCEAREFFEDGKESESREAAITANRLSPDLVPAAIMASDSYVEQGKPKYAVRAIRKAWEAAAHPDLAAAFARIAPNENPDERIKRFRTLINLHRDHPESKMLEAELQIAAEDFPAARKALGELAETDPTARSLTIMAAIERGSGADDAVVKGWLARALNASRGPQWVCEKCHKAHIAWRPVCDGCEGFDTLAWAQPPETAAAMVTGSGMLPLIVGEIEDRPDIIPDEVIDEHTVEIEGDNIFAAPDNEDETDDESSEADITKTANADAPPLDYEVIQPDGDSGDSESKKETT
ncbi:MAG: heme biosynthesis protein HemY [Boseongicola sp.]